MTRRVELGDLVRNGTLRVGERITLHRRDGTNSGARLQQIHAEIDENGDILLFGERFESPSGAALRAGGYRTSDGWLRWRVDRLGKTLAEVRATARPST